MLTHYFEDSNREPSIYEWAKNKTLVIPEYQRSFTTASIKNSWLAEDICTLAGEIKSGEEEYDCVSILGLITYDEGNGNCLIIDGHQRLTSINILIKAFNELLMEEDIDDIEPIEYINLDYKAFSMKDEYEKKFINSSGSKYAKVLAGYKDILRNYLNCFEEIKDIIKNKICFSDNKAYTEDEAIKIYSNINGNNTPLNFEETLKAIFQEAFGNFGINEKYSEDYQDYINAYIKHTRDDYSNENMILRIATIRKNILDTKEHLDDFVKFYKNCKKYETRGIFQIISKLSRKQLNDVYYVFVNTKGFENKQRRASFEDSVFPIMFLESLALTIENCQGTKPRKMYEEFVKTIKNAKTADEAKNSVFKYIEDNKLYTTQEKFYEFCIGNKSKFNSYIALLMLCCSHANQGISYETATGEHCYPQNPKENAWTNQGFTITNDEEKNILTHSLGNIFLLPNSYNIKCSNKYIDEKEIEYKKALGQSGVYTFAENQVDFDKFKHGKDTAIKYVKERTAAVVQSIVENFAGAKNIFR